MKNFKVNLNININLADCIKALFYYIVFDVLNEPTKKFLVEFISFILKQTN